jgi:hypothetical protein
MGNYKGKPCTGPGKLLGSVGKFTHYNILKHICLKGWDVEFNSKYLQFTYQRGDSSLDMGLYAKSGTYYVHISFITSTEAGFYSSLYIVRRSQKLFFAAFSEYLNFKMNLGGLILESLIKRTYFCVSFMSMKNS